MPNTKQEDDVMIDRIREDVHEIRSHMKDHDLLIRVSTVLESVLIKVDNIEKSMGSKADTKDVEEVERRLTAVLVQQGTRIDTIARDNDKQKAFINRAIGGLLVIELLTGIILGILPYIKHS